MKSLCQTVTTWQFCVHRTIKIYIKKLGVVFKPAAQKGEKLTASVADLLTDADDSAADEANAEAAISR